MCQLPPHLLRSLASSTVVGFSGSRSVVTNHLVLSSVFRSVPVHSQILVGCARGLDSAVRSAFPRAIVYQASSFGSGRGSFARRSSYLIRGLRSFQSSCLLAFPLGFPPVGLRVSSKSSVCFAGFGSGTWASIAYSVGTGVPVFVYSPSTCLSTFHAGFICLGGGWWYCPQQGVFF